MKKLCFVCISVAMMGCASTSNQREILTNETMSSEEQNNSSIPVDEINISVIGNSNDDNHLADVSGTQLPPVSLNVDISENAIDISEDSMPNELESQGLSENTDEIEDEPNDSSLLHTSPELKNLSSNAEWFIPEISRKWYKQVSKKANRSYLSSYFEAIGYQVPKDTYALIAPLKIRDGQFMMQYYSYKSTAFVYSMTKDGHENFWPASTVKLAAAVMALLKLSEYKASSQAIVKMTDIEGSYDNTVEKLCREAIIPSNNTAYNRLMEIAGFDEINEHYLREVFHFPKMILQRRYQRANPDDNLRYSPNISFHDNKISGMIPERRSSGKIYPECPRESNCSTLAELAEVMFRVVLHEELNINRRLKLDISEINMLRDALKKAPSCIGEGVAEVMGNDAVIYNKGGKVFADDRLEIAVVSSSDKKERYLIALSMPYYEGVEKETNHLAKLMIEAMRHTVDVNAE